MEWKENKSQLNSIKIAAALYPSKRRVATDWLGWKAIIQYNS
jgi:hypothetical protein